METLLYSFTFVFLKLLDRYFKNKNHINIEINIVVILVLC